MNFPVLLAATLLFLIEVTSGSEDICRIEFDKYDRMAKLSRNFLVGQSNRWPNNEVPYNISDKFSISDRLKIVEAIRILQKVSCIKFVEHTTQRNHVWIFTGRRGCYANVGYNRYRTVTQLHLQTNSYCMTRGTIQHELLHVLGFLHEHTRPDRDDYIKILWDNLPNEGISNWFRCGGENEDPLPPICDSQDPTSTFDGCYSGYRTTTLGEPYDYGSVMHYGLRAGTPYGVDGMQTKKPVKIGTVIGQRKGPSNYDILKLNKAYNCNYKPAPDSPTTTTTEEPEPTTTDEPQPTTVKPEPTTTTTKAKETTTDDCSDEFTFCGDYKAFCYNKFMKSKCRTTCGFCGAPMTTTPEPCKDKLSICDGLEKFCERHAYIRRSCQSTCGLC